MVHGDGSEDSGGALPGSPGRRALGAMEQAARRAREGLLPGPVAPGRGGPIAEGPPTQWREQPVVPRQPPPPQDPPPRRAPGGHGGPPVAGQERWLRIAVGFTAALVVVAAASLAAVLATRQTPTGGGGTPTTVAPHAAAPPGSARHHGTRSHTSASTSTTVVVAPGSPAQISSLSPSSGGPGQTVVIAGSGLMSSNGQIIATFDGQTAPTDCPQPSSCTVTVPTLSPAPTGPVTVIVTTAAGASNGLRFTYQ